MGGEPGPVFVVGAARSGTTLMRAILTAHSGLHITDETHFIPRVRGRWPVKGALDDGEAGALWQAVVGPTCSRLGIDEAAAKRRLEFDDDDGPSACGMFRALLQEDAANRGKPRWGEKTPLHFGDVDLLLGWFPFARVIWMIRDPRAVVASRQRTWWGAPAGLEEHAEAVRQSLRRARRFRADPRVITARYERLVRYPESEALRICEFLGEPFERSMLDREAMAAAGANNTSFPRHDGGAEAPIDASAASRWRRVLSPREQTLVEVIARPEMIAWGYRPESSRLRRHLGQAELSARRKLRWTRARLAGLRKW